MELQDRSRLYPNLPPQGGLVIGPDGRLQYAPLPQVQPIPSAPPASGYAQPQPVQRPPVQVSYPVISGPILNAEAVSAQSDLNSWAKWVKIFSVLLLIMNITFHAVWFLYLPQGNISQSGHQPCTLRLIGRAVLFVLICVAAKLGLRAAKLKTSKSAKCFIKALVVVIVVMLIGAGIGFYKMRNRLHEGMQKEDGEGRHRGRDWENDGSKQRGGDWKGEEERHRDWDKDDRHREWEKEDRHKHRDEQDQRASGKSSAETTENIEGRGRVLFKDLDSIINTVRSLHEKSQNQIINQEQNNDQAQGTSPAGPGTSENQESHREGDLDNSQGKDNQSEKKHSHHGKNHDENKEKHGNSESKHGDHPHGKGLRKPFGRCLVAALAQLAFFSLLLFLAVKLYRAAKSYEEKVQQGNVPMVPVLQNQPVLAFSSGINYSNIPVGSPIYN